MKTMRPARAGLPLPLLAVAALAAALSGGIAARATVATDAAPPARAAEAAAVAEMMARLPVQYAVADEATRHGR